MGVLSELSLEIKGLSQAYQDKEKASQSILHKLSANQHQAVKNAHLEVSEIVQKQVQDKLIV